MAEEKVLSAEEIAKQVGGKVVDEWETGQEIKAGWIKLPAAGDSVKGTLVNKRYQKSNKPGFKDQWVYELLVDGGVVNIGFSIDKTFLNNKLKNVVVGQIVMIKRMPDFPSKMFPGKFAASYDARLYGMDPDYKDETVDEEENVGPESFA
jgi:hypothetical protein